MNVPPASSKSGQANTNNIFKFFKIVCLFLRTLGQELASTKSKLVIRI